jgi:hypothetical protein
MYSVIGGGDTLAATKSGAITLSFGQRRKASKKPTISRRAGAIEPRPIAIALANMIFSIYFFIKLIIN